MLGRFKFAMGSMLLLLVFASAMTGCGSGPGAAAPGGSSGSSASSNPFVGEWRATSFAGRVDEYTTTTKFEANGDFVVTAVHVSNPSRTDIVRGTYEVRRAGTVDDPNRVPAVVQAHTGDGTRAIVMSMTKDTFRSQWMGSGWYLLTDGTLRRDMSTIGVNLNDAVYQRVH